MTVDMSRLDVPAAVVEARAATLARRAEIRDLYHAQAAEARRNNDPDGAAIALQYLAIREESWAMTDKETGLRHTRRAAYDAHRIGHLLAQDADIPPSTPTTPEEAP